MLSTPEVVVNHKNESEPVSRASNSGFWQLGETVAEESDIAVVLALAVHRGLVSTSKRQHLPVRV
jgi:hypothetical protein